MAKDMIRTEELAEALACSPQCALLRAKRRGVEGVFTGRVLRWPRSAIKALKPRRRGRPKAVRA